MMYSDVPRTLVYKDIESISDILGSSSEPSLEREFYDRLVKRPFMKNASNPPRCALTVFNNARYIYYLIKTEEDSISLCFNIYMAKAVDYLEYSETRDHIQAATMALVYNWLSTNSEKADFKELNETIYLHFSDEEKELTAGCNEDFHALLMKDCCLPNSIDALSEDLRDISDAANNAPVQDVAIGIDYLLECDDTVCDTNGDCYMFWNKILKRLESEKSLVKDSSIMEEAKVKINRRLQKLEFAPEPEPVFNLSLSNMLSQEEIDEMFGNDDEGIPSELKEYIGWISNSSKAVKILATIEQYMEGKIRPKALLMPLCAALEVGVISKPTFKEYKIVFKNHPVMSEDSFSRWVSSSGAKTYNRESKTSKIYNVLKEQFSKFL